MSEFERLLDETLAVGMGDEYFQPWSKGLEVARAALIAYHERAVEAYELVKKDVYNLTEKVIPNIREAHERALAERDARIAVLEAACDGLNKALQKLAKEEP